jgi:hypothetical protein
VNPLGREDRVGPALLVAMLLAALIVGGFVYHARTPNLALEVLTIERTAAGDGPNAKVRVVRDARDLPVLLEFFVRFDDPHGLVEIVGEGDVSVRTFAADAELFDGQRVECQWDGRDDAGDPAPAGNYRLHVELPAQGRDMVFPQRIGLLGDFHSPAIAEPCVRDDGEPLE